MTTPLTLTERQREVLRELECVKRCNVGSDGWATPMHVGGRDASHHSATLAQLVRKGLAERRERGGWTKSSWLYRITAAGRDAVAVAAMVEAAQRMKLTTRATTPSHVAPQASENEPVTDGKDESQR